MHLLCSSYSLSRTNMQFIRFGDLRRIPCVTRPLCFFHQHLSVLVLNDGKSATRLPLQILASNHYGTNKGSGLLDGLKKITGLSRSVNRVQGFGLYESINSQINVETFFQGLKMPDTFHSWFLVTKLHVWMLMARLMVEGDQGRIVRNALVEALWQDVDFRSKQLGEMATSVRQKQILGLEDEFRAFIFSFDEAILSSDHVLAGALWRHIFLQRDFDPRHLEILVLYVRQNLAALDKMSKEDLLAKKFKWIPLKF